MYQVTFILPNEHKRIEFVKVANFPFVPTIGQKINFCHSSIYPHLIVNYVEVLIGNHDKLFINPDSKSTVSLPSGYEVSLKVWLIYEGEN